MKKWIDLWICIAIVSAITIAGSAGLYVYVSNHVVYEDEPVLFGATYMTMNNEFYDVIDNELRNRIEADGNRLVTMDPQLSLTRQIEEIEEMIDMGIQVLIVNPVDSSGLEEVLEKADAQGIAVIAIDANVYSESDFVDYTVVSDNYEAGVLCAERLMEERDKADVLVLTHEAAYSAVERIQGFKDTLAGYPQYRIVAEEECEGQLEKSMPAVEQVIHNGVHFDAVMALNDPSAIGAVAAIRECDMEQNGIMVFGVDGTPEAKNLIQDGYMTATVAQSPRQMAEKAVEASRMILLGKSELDEEKIPVELIDSSNIDAFMLEGWQ